MIYISCFSWNDLHSFCEGYGEQIQVTQNELYAYIMETPTVEESRNIAERLAKQLQLEMNKAHHEGGGSEASGNQGFDGKKRAAGSMNKSERGRTTVRAERISGESRGCNKTQRTRSMDSTKKQTKFRRTGSVGNKKDLNNHDNKQQREANFERKGNKDWDTPTQYSEWLLNG